MTNTQKILLAAGLVVVLALIIYGVHAEKSPYDASSEIASTTTPGLTDSGSTSPLTVTPTARPVSAPTPVKPLTVVVPLGKTVVDHVSGISLMLKSADLQTKDSGAQVYVAYLSVNTAVCTAGKGCIARDDTKQNIQGSAPYAFNYNGYFVELTAVTASNATFTVTKSPN